MDFMKAFEDIMETAQDLALSTSVGEQSNVRIMNFVWCNNCKTVFMSSLKGTPKTNEIAQNENAAFMTVPTENISFVRAKGIIKLSSKNISELKDTFIKKYPNYEQMFAMGLDKFELYELTFKEADVSRGFGDFGKVTL